MTYLNKFRRTEVCNRRTDRGRDIDVVVVES